MDSGSHRENYERVDDVEMASLTMKDTRLYTFMFPKVTVELILSYLAYIALWRPSKSCLCNVGHKYRFSPF